ncbi:MULTISPECIES: hypothetical protein [unclassified Lentimonas]|nr:MULTISPECIES: hypothetical protein [unclassified Lentimonas]
MKKSMTMGNVLTKSWMLKVASAFAFLGVIGLLPLHASGESIAVAPTAVLEVDGELYVTAKHAQQILKLSTDGDVLARLPLDAPPESLSLATDTSAFWVGTADPMGRLYQVNRADFTIRETLTSGHTPSAIVPLADKLYVCNRFEDEVAVFQGGQLVQRIAVPREPIAAQLSKDKSRLYVANHLPNVRADGDIVSCEVSVIDTATDQLIKTIVLPDGITGIRDIALTADGRYILTASLLARHRVPATQLERGWINTNALCLIDTQSESFYATVLLDDVDRGAANPWGIACADTGDIFVACAGIHSVIQIDGEALIQHLESLTAEQRAALAYNLSFLSGLKTVISLQGKGSRDLFLAGNKLYVAQYFSDTVECIHLDQGNRVEVMPLSGALSMTEERRGEFLFNDASYCYQNWMSCASCHPDTRTDGINWDLLNDGFGNPKQAKNMLYAHRTPPTTVTGCRPGAEVSVRAGIHFLMATLPETDALAIDQFLMELPQVPSPALENGELSASALRGKLVFEQAKCIRCHSGEYFTDMELHNIATGLGRETDQKFDTPTLREVWRTRPYLHDGRAATLESIFKEHDPLGRHGKTQSLSPEDFSDLMEYVRSL